MSSTNRGGERHVSDYYITPQEEIIRFLSAFENVYKDQVDFKSDSFYDPCSGGGYQEIKTKTGEIVSSFNNPMAYPKAFMDRYGRRIFTSDIRQDSGAAEIMSYIDIPEEGVVRGVTPLVFPKIIITNPPFSHAIPIIEQALKDIAEDGFVIMLLRLNFMGSVGRERFFLDNPPESQFVHSRRMSFTPDGKKDSVEYAHFVWRKQNTNSFKHTKQYHISPLNYPVSND